MTEIEVLREENKALHGKLRDRDETIGELLDYINAQGAVQKVIDLIVRLEGLAE